MLENISNKNSEKYYTFSPPLQIYQQEKNNITCNSQIIYPIIIENNSYGCVIFNSMKDKINNEDIKYIKALTKTIIYLNISEKEAKKSELNYSKKIFSNEMREHLIKIIEDPQGFIYSNKQFLYINELLKIKIDSLKNKLIEEDILLLDEILDLMREVQSYNLVYIFLLVNEFYKKPSEEKNS